MQHRNRVQMMSPAEIEQMSKITGNALDGLKVLIMPSVRFLSASTHGTIEKAATGGLTVLRAGPCVGLAGARGVDYDVTYWHRSIKAGYRQRECLNAQYLDAEKYLLPNLRAKTAPPVVIESQTGIGKLYIVGDALLVMIANWELHKPSTATLTPESKTTVTDVLSGKTLNGLNGKNCVTVDIPPAGWRVLKLEARP